MRVVSEAPPGASLFFFVLVLNAGLFSYVRLKRIFIPDVRGEIPRNNA